MNPNEILSQSPGLRGTSYPGSTVTRHPNPNGHASSRAAPPKAATLLGLTRQKAYPCIIFTTNKH